VGQFQRKHAVRAIAAHGLTLALGDDSGIAVVELDEDELRPVRQPRYRRGRLAARRSQR
jgi:hypothetical protein